MKPQEPIPHNYRMSTLNKVFALSSLALLALVGAMVMYDYARGWKRFQLEFLRVQRDRITQQLEVARRATGEEQLRALDQRMREGEADIARKRAELREAEDTVREWEGRHYRADQDFRFAKAVLDSLRYEAEVLALRKARGWEGKQQEFREQETRVERLKLVLEDVSASRDAALARRDGILSRIAEIEREKKDLLADVELLEKQLATVDFKRPEFLLLNMPLLDFVSPTLKVEQVVLNDMFVDMNYMVVPRVDRCMTCHKGIDRPGFESREEAQRLIAELEGKLDGFQIAPDRIADTMARIEQLRPIAEARRNLRNPYRTHPRLDMFVGSASPHPLLEYGCTSCHRGLDRATDFARAGHTPSSEEQQKRWEEHYGWKRQPFLESPMHPRQYFEASCIKCHSGEVRVDEADRISEGTQMIELYGCAGCHKIDNWRFQDLRKPGPDLRGIAEKTSPEWTVRWLTNPKDFRATTRMPSFFYLRNMVGPHIGPAERESNEKKQNAEIQAIVAYLFANSTRRGWPEGPSGDPARGAALVDTVGCYGCHVAQETVTDSAGAVRTANRDDFPLERNYGFNLVGTGTKTRSDWLFHWLKNPRNYYQQAPMPDLRLTDQEAADITAWLMSLRKPDFMNMPVAPADRAALSELSRSYMITSMTERETDARLASMTSQQQLVFLGQRTIEKYGCFGCHDIKGFEDAKPIGTELTIEGSKNIHLFDFGFVHDFETESGEHEHVLHTVPSWIYAKVRSPRVFDDQRERGYHDKLKMPNFFFTRNEAEAVTGVVLGLTKDRVAPERIAARTSEARVAQEGRKLVSQNNCRACHVVDGHGGAIAQTVEDPGMLPPDLGPEGSRVQSDWLFAFLKDPTVMALRPWLGARMPTFHFSDGEADKITRYFAADANVPTFETDDGISPHPQSAAVGGIVFDMLRCAQCHPTQAVAATAEADLASLAPNLQLSRERLRHDWVPDWILRPNEIVPGTRMPTNFPRNAETGEYESPLTLAIGSPQFASYRQALLQHFRSEEEMLQALADAPRISHHLRDYIWTIGIRSMPPARDPVEEPPPYTPETPPPAPAPGVQSTSLRVPGGETPGR
ncbi:MAG TPA: c-type cytochrome [Thermoanaerobaculia bacterium]|nr:c-type cytochrome [Thermoanaerobaculia bacterium]